MSLLSGLRGRADNATTFAQILTTFARYISMVIIHVRLAVAKS
jgi:hypothetical protein